MRSVAAIAAIAGVLMSAGPAHAQRCLDRETLTAARLNEFGTLMMAVSLRCKASGVDISPSYEAMLQAYHPAFSAADRRLRAFFAPDVRAFDAYSTRLGNRYGGGATDPANCQRFGSVARDLSVKTSGAALGKVVFAMVGEPRIQGSACAKP